MSSTYVYCTCHNLPIHWLIEEGKKVRRCAITRNELGIECLTAKGNELEPSVQRGAKMD